MKGIRHFIRNHRQLCQRIAVISGILALVGGVWFWRCLPEPLFNAPLSVVVSDQQGSLLSASIAADEQWRFPPVTNVPEKFTQALLHMEDRRFFKHAGVDGLALGRAIWLNLRQKRIVSGASTLTMQVIRLARHNRDRTIREKLIEMILAVRLEVSFSKNEILALYASYAPFGGNVVGLDAAAWRYFGREPANLSWAESAMLAVLPNNPALVHPGKNRQVLQQKRDRLLDTLQEHKVIDDLTCTLAKAEPLPPAPYPIPMLAPHLLARMRGDMPQGQLSTITRIQTTIQKSLQMRATDILQRHARELAGNGIYNAAALIADVSSGNVLAYIGNVTSGTLDNGHGEQVDVITAPRSTGSTLKPLLYAGMLNAGELLPSQLVADTPLRIGGFAPQNYARTFQGAVPAYMALARSLNIPSVRLLRSYGVDRFTALLKQLGMTTVSRPAAEYGLSLILGGAEGTLWDLTGIYASMARRVNNYATADPEQPAFFPLRYVEISLPAPPLFSKERGPGGEFFLRSDNPLDAAACWLTFDAMLEVVRPGEEGGWRNFSSSRKVAWKTGTSFGYRDAWALGVTPRYVVGIWVGNADGEGRPALTGVSSAAPILFELFGLLDGQDWFPRPEADLVQIEVCAQSGYRAGPHCAHTTTTWATRTGLRTTVCPYCQIIHTDVPQAWRVHSGCERVAAITPVKWFVLPPAMEWYYKKNHSDYLALPPYRSDCLSTLPGASAMTLIYPDPGGRIYVPVELDSQRGRAVFEAAHRASGATIFWHLDDEYIGETRDIHQMEAAPTPGEHTLTLVDEDGELLQRRFIVLAQ